MLIPKFDALLNKIKDGSITEDSSAPTSKGNGYFSVVDDFLLYFTGGNRYKIQAVIDNPIGGDNYYASLWGLFANINN